MKIFDITKLEELVSIRQDNSISIYIPTHVKGKEVKDGMDSLALKNELQFVRNLLKENGWKEGEADKYLEPIYDLVDDSGFWHNQKQGLAIFLSGDFFEYYRLPISFENFSLLSNGFYLKPLIPMVKDLENFYILALSLAKVRLFEVNRYFVHEIPLSDDLEEGVNKILNYYQFEESVQQRSRHGGTSSGDNVQYYGQGEAKTDNTPYIEEYFRHINDELSKFFSSKEQLMVIASVDYLQPIYRSVNTQNLYLEEGISGNPDELKGEELLRKALPVVEPHLKKVRQRTIEKYQRLAGTGKTSYNLEEIVKASGEGRIESLFIARNAHKWGKVKENGETKIEIHEEFQHNDQDLLGKSAVQTILNGGDAYLLNREDLPEEVADTDLVAVFRY